MEQNVQLMNYSQENLQSIQAMRGIAALGVLLFHIAHMLGGYGVETPLLYFASFGHSGVDVFFVISGLVMVLTTYDKIGDKGLVSNFIKKRAIRVYSNYWMIAGILSIISLFGLATININASWFESLLLLPLSGKAQIIPVAWTLSFEVFFYFIFAIFLGARSIKTLKISLIIWALIIIIANIFIEREKGITPFYTAFFFSPFHLEFIMGCFVGLFLKSNLSLLKFLKGIMRESQMDCSIIKDHGYSETKYVSTALIIGTIIYISTIIITINSPLSGWENTYARVYSYGIASALILYGIVSLEYKRHLKMPNFLNQLGNSSYTLYLVHMPILYLISKYLPYSENWNILTLYLHIIMLIATPTLYSIGHYRLLERPLLDLLRQRFLLMKASK